jgi:hypothetical protein
MLPWTRSAWFRRAVTGLSTVFVAVVLATSLMAEGSALKRHDVEYESVACPEAKKAKGEAGGRSRPARGCRRKRPLSLPIQKNAKISQDDVVRALATMPRFTGPRGLRGERGPRGLSGRTGMPGARGTTGRRGIEGTRGRRGATGDEGSSGAPGAAGRDGEDG